MRRRMLSLLLILTLVLAFTGCKKESNLPPVDDFSDVEQYDEITPEPSGDIIEEDAPDAEVSEDEVVEAPAEDEESRVLVAKTYKQLHPELYNFYPENPKMTYTKWVYTIDKSSSFIGSIIYPDGTTIIGNGDVKDSIDIDTGDFTKGESPNTPSSPSDVEQTVKDEKLEGDEKINPAGEVVTIDGGEGTNVTVTTKVIEDAVIDKTNTNPYVLDFSAKGVEYTIKSDTIDATMNKLLQEGLYEGLSGSVYINTPATVSTSKGTYTEYTIYSNDGAAQVYAVTYTPRYTSNTVYLMYSDDLSNNNNLMEMLQKMIVE